MGVVITEATLENLLEKVNSKQGKINFEILLEQLFVFTIELDLLNEQINEGTVKSNLNNLKLIEGISRYLFSEFNNPFTEYDNELRIQAFELVGVCNEKIARYISAVNNIDEVPQEIIKLKLYKCLWRAAIAFSLAGNVPNSIFVAKKMKESFEVLSTESFSKELRDLFELSNFILNREFTYIAEFQTERMTYIYSDLSIYMMNGSKVHLEYIFSNFESLKSEARTKHDIEYFWFVKYLEIAMRKIVKSSVWNLLGDDYSNEYINTLVRSSNPIYELWKNQAEVIEDDASFIKSNLVDRILINFPTSGGKSLLAELAIVKEIERDANAVCFYIVPTNALIFEVKKRLMERLNPLNIRVNTSIDDFNRELISFEEYNQVNIFIMTPEKLEVLVRNNSELLSAVKLMVIDEFHKVGSLDRGWIIESLITYLNVHKDYSSIKLMVISAFIDNQAEVFEWFTKGRNVINKNLISSTWRPTYLIQGIAEYEYHPEWYRYFETNESESMRYRPDTRVYLAENKVTYLLDERRNYVVDLGKYPRYHNIKDYKLNKDYSNRFDFIRHIAEKYKSLGGTLVYFSTKKNCESFIQKYIEYESNNSVELNPSIYPILEFIKRQLTADHLLVKGIEKGILYHHGDLSLDIREAVEEIYLNGYVNLLVSTSTLVEGVNFPIQTLIYTGKSYETEHSLNLIDFTNIIGRAGRAFQSTYGQIIHINYYKNLIEEHIKYDSHEKDIKSSLLNEEIIRELEELEDLTEWNQLKNCHFLKHLIIYYLDFQLKSFDEIVEVMNNTLFSKQANEIEYTRVIEVVRKVFAFYESYDKQELYKIKLSGLSPMTYKHLKQIAVNIVERLEKIDEDITISTLISKKNYLDILSLKEANPPKISNLRYSIDHYGLFMDWTENNISVKEIGEKYFSKFSENERWSKVAKYIQDLFEYKLPIIFNCLCEMILEISEHHYTLLNDFSYMVKKGLCSNEEVLLYKLGINSRETIKSLVRMVLDKNLQDKNQIKEFLLSLEPNILFKGPSSVSVYEIRKIIQVANNLREIDFNRRRYSLTIDLDSIGYPNTIILEAETYNQFNPFAVKVMINGDFVGYVPIMYSEEISRQLQLNKNYEISIENYSITKLNFSIIFDK